MRTTRLIALCALAGTFSVTGFAAERSAANFTPAPIGVEGMEQELGRAMATAVRTLRQHEPYQHYMNDALVKSLLNSMQFAKDRGLMKELVAHDLKTVSPMMIRTGHLIEKTNDPELALVAMFERTSCHYQLVSETHKEPGKRSYVSPYKTVLAATRRLEQFDMTEEWIHSNWTVPRFEGVAEMMGVNLAISEWNEDGLITVELIDSRLAAKQ